MMMKSRKVLLLGVVGLALLSTGAQAMMIYNFIKMNDDDDATYVTSMVEGTAQMLRTHGHADQATKLIAFFKDSSKAGGVNQFAMNMKMYDSLNTQNAANARNRAPVYDVEDAMALTLKKQGIIVTPVFLRSINQDFSPAGPPRGHAPSP